MRKTPLAALLCSVIFVACGTSDGGEAPGGHEHDESSEEIQQKGREMRESGDFVAARDALHACLENLGYQNVGTPNVVLLDGSTIPAGRQHVTGALLDYQIHREQCIAQTGFDEVVASHGLADPTPNPGLMRLINEQSVAQMTCLAEKGYDVPEPKTLRGQLIFDFPLRSEEEEAAFRTDITGCNREIWGSDFPPR